MPRKRKGTLTDKQERFCWLYVMGNDSGKALKPVDLVTASGFKSRSLQNRYHEYRRLLDNRLIQTRIEELRKWRDREFLVDRKFVIENLRKIAEEEKDTPQKVKALELLGKTLGLFEEKISISKDEHAQIAEEAWRKRVKKIRENKEDEVEAIKLGILQEREEINNETEVQD